MSAPIYSVTLLGDGVSQFDFRGSSLEETWAVAESPRSGGRRMRLVLDAYRRTRHSASTDTGHTHISFVRRRVVYGIEIGRGRLRPHSNLIVVLNGAQAIFWPVLAIFGHLIPEAGSATVRKSALPSGSASSVNLAS